jgi:phenylacetate-CoA ligase
MFRYIFSYLAIYFFWSIRWVLGFDRNSYLLLSAPQIQPFLAWIGRLRAFAVFYKAKRDCPAYADFLKAENYNENGAWNIADVPVMTKENYVKKFSIEERCYGGKIPTVGTVIDESSGSSGAPNNWVRSAEERKDVKRILQLNYEIVFGSETLILLNCFALGPWATGMNVSMSLADVGILKSIGPDAAKLENTLSLFGPKYKYVICGYPPFLKMWLDSTELDLSNFKIHAIVGGEGMSESLRNHLLKYFQTAISSYGASDLEINIGVETELTIELRRLCFKNRELCEKLFGRETPPMIFQYNAADYLIETNEEGELLFTIVRLEGAAPKIRYNLRDLGGSYSHQELGDKLAENNIKIADLTKRQSAFPMVFVHGRGDLSVPFYGAKIFPTDLEEIISTHPKLVGKINSFQLQSLEDETLKRTLVIYLERVKNFKNDLPEPTESTEIIFEELCRVNQDFREVTKMFDKSCVQLHLHDFETGVFAGRDIRIKNKYIG